MLSIENYTMDVERPNISHYKTTYYYHQGQCIATKKFNLDTREVEYSYNTKNAEYLLANDNFVNDSNIDNAAYDAAYREYNTTRNKLTAKFKEDLKENYNTTDNIVEYFYQRHISNGLQCVIDEIDYFLEF